MSAEYYISSNKYNIQERTTKKNGRVYDVVFRIIDKVTLDEKQKRLSGYKTKALCKEAYLAFVTEKCELVKNNPVKKKDPTRADLTVGELVSEYMASLGNQNKDSSIYGKQKIFDAFILPAFSRTKIKDLTTEMLYRWQDELWQKRNPNTGAYYSHKYLTNIRGFFRTFLGWCESRYGYHNPFTSIAKPKNRAPKVKMQIWTKAEFDHFISCVDDPLFHAFFTLLFYTGRRKGEIFALTPQDIHGDTITFNKSLTRRTFSDATYEITSTKAEKDQNVPICTTVQNELKNYGGQSPFYFGGDVPVSDNKLRREFVRYTEIAGLHHIRIHDLRHSFVSMLIHLGANFMIIAELIGDTVEQVIKTYGHMYENDKREIISLIG